MQRRWAGHADPPLTEAGRKQAKDACGKFEEMGFSFATSSALQRARETASIISRHLNIGLLDPVPDLNERHAGRISGLTSDEIEEQFPEFLNNWRKGINIDIPGGEKLDDFVSRVQKGLTGLSSVSGRILVVVHEGVLKAAEYLSGEEQRKHDNLEGIWV